MGDGSVSAAGIPWMLRLVPSTRDQARCLLPLAKRWTFLVPPDRDGRQIAMDLREAAQSLDLPAPRVVVAATDFNESQLTEVLDALAHPEAVLLWLPAPSAASWTKCLRGRGFRDFLAGPCSLRSTLFAEAAGPAAEGFLVARLQSLAVPNSLAQGFDRDYRARFDTAPDELAWFAADAIHLAAAWLAEPSAATTRDLGIGLTGPWQFSQNGDRRGTFEIFNLRDGRWIPRQVGGPSRSQPTP
jgi:ABC-type branched-subunit amino acid transport system substrate-binding protein